MTVEQRIGRLDRIGRSIPVEVVFFRPPSGLGCAVIELYESLGLFREPLGGLERELAGVQSAIEELALEPGADAAPSRFESIVWEAREAVDRVQQAAYHELHRDPYVPELGAGILARVPEDLEELTEEVVVAACERLQLHIEGHRGVARYSIEIGRQARVENLPGVAGDANFLGSFDRIEALEDESIDFYASGHPLVEGILAHLEESSLGRVALLHIRSDGDDDGIGLLALYKHGPAFEAVALDASGRWRPDWAAWATRRPLKSRRVRAESWTRQPGWPELVRSLAKRLEDRGHPVAVAGLRVERRRS
jgi:ATP-dependent helicase HepA